MSDCVTNKTVERRLDIISIMVVGAVVEDTLFYSSFFWFSKKLLGILSMHEMSATLFIHF